MDVITMSNYFKEENTFKVYFILNKNQDPLKPQ